MHIYIKTSCAFVRAVSAVRSHATVDDQVAGAGALVADVGVSNKVTRPGVNESSRGRIPCL